MAVAVYYSNLEKLLRVRRAVLCGKQIGGG